MMKARLFLLALVFYCASALLPSSISQRNTVRSRRAQLKLKASFIFSSKGLQANSNNNNNGKSSLINGQAKKTYKNSVVAPASGIDHDYMAPPDVDAMRAGAGKLRREILEKQMELQRLEQKIVCCSSGRGGAGSSGDGSGGFEGNNENLLQNSVQIFNRAVTTFVSSSNVLIRKVANVQNKIGPNNQRWESVGDYVADQASTIPRIVGGLIENPGRLKYLVDPDTPTLVSHVPGILAHLDKLESHLPPILERVLNNQRHLGSIEPYLPEIFERFDDIEPHLPWILDNIDTLAPYTGLLLKHIDELLLYADAADFSEDDDYALAEQLLPYLEYYVSRLDVIGPHLPLLRPHVPKLLQHNRIGKISPHIDRLFARGYKDLSASANIDVLLYYFGWSLRIPGLPKLFFALPGSPRIVSLLANRLPKRFVRRYCSGVTCSVDNDYGANWNSLGQVETKTASYGKKWNSLNGEGTVDNKTTKI